MVKHENLTLYLLLILSILKNTNHKDLLYSCQFPRREYVLFSVYVYWVEEGGKVVWGEQLLLFISTLLTTCTIYPLFNLHKTLKAINNVQMMWFILLSYVRS